MAMGNAKTIDEFISNYPEEVQSTLQKIRQTVKNVCPEAQEKISYGIPTFTFHGKNLVHFSAYDTHYSFYPGSVPITVLAKELASYGTSKGTVRFPVDKPVPYDLIEQMTKLAMERNLEKKK